MGLFCGNGLWRNHGATSLVLCKKRFNAEHLVAFLPNYGSDISGIKFSNLRESSATAL